MPRPPCGMPILKASTYIKGGNVATIERIAEERGWSISKTIAELVREALTHAGRTPGAPQKPKHGRHSGSEVLGRSRGGARRGSARLKHRGAPEGQATERSPHPPAGSSKDAAKTPPALDRVPY